MKRIVILLAIAMITASTVGCGCCRRLRDWFYQGSYCGPAAAPMVTAPPMVVPQYVAPTCCPPAYTVDPGCGDPYAGQVSYGPAFSDGCATYDSGAYATPSPQTFVTPSPE